MHSISPILRRLSRRVAAPAGDAGSWLDAQEAYALWGAALDGGLPELELGALLASFAIAGESADELLGFHRALATRQARFSPGLARRAVSIPVHGLIPGEAAFSVLLALFLRRFDVPVVMHGPLDSPDGPSAPALLREMGVLPSVSLTDAGRDLGECGIVFLPVQLLSPALGDLLALRTRLGTTNSSHLAAHAMDPGGMGAVRLAMSVAGTPSGRLAGMLAATGGEALLLSWPPAAPACDLAFRPRISRWSEGEEAVVFEAENVDRASHAGLPGPAQFVPWMRAVVERRAPAPLPLVNLAAACVHAAGAAVDLTQAKAVVALQSGRLAA
jgi:anthranilate phosphoribosyltransferase